MKIVIKDPADLQDALDLRAKVDHHKAVADAVAAKQQKKQRTCSSDPLKPTGAKHC